MFYLGQSVIHKPYVNAPKRAAIISGFSNHDSPLITFVNTDGELKKHDNSFMVDLHPIRKKNTKSPTGFSIYTGKIAKTGYTASNVKLRLPDDSLVVAELKASQKIIDSTPD